MTQFQTVIQKIQERLDEFGIVLNPPATTAAIEEFERVYGLTIPADILSFYSYCNGFEALTDFFNVLSLEEITREQINYQTGIVGREFIFAEYMIYSDSWNIRLTPNGHFEYEIINSNHGTDEVVVLTNSLADFIVRYLDGNGVFGDEGLYAWYEQRKAGK